MIVFPIGVEPVNPSFLMSGCSDMACPMEEPKKIQFDFNDI